MPVERLTPRDRAAWLDARRRDVTASQIAALFGEHPYVTPFQLYAAKTGLVSEDDIETPAMERGNLLEAPAVKLLKKRHPRWKVTHNSARFVYFRDPADRMGATPDVIVVDRDRGLGVVQVKTVDAGVFRRDWHPDGRDGAPEPPLWIAMQASLEAHLVGAKWAAVAAFVWGSRDLEMPLIDVPLVPGVIDAMRVKVAAFWKLIEEGGSPPVDYTRDGATIEAMYRGDEEAEVDLSADNRIPELIRLRADASARARSAAADLEAIDAEIKAKMGDAVVGHIGRGRRITWRTVRRDGHFVAPSSFRQLRVPPPEKE